jgi:hypothetical protein
MIKKIIQRIREYRFIVLPVVLIGMFVYVYTYLHGTPFQSHAQSTATVTFGAVGDMGGSSNGQAVLSAAAGANLNFFLHVGDFSYDSQGGPSGWPTWVKSIVGTILPYEIVEGNHDSCCIATYVQGLPHKISNLGQQFSGSYGIDYYFDYPTTSPLMRVIMISPGLYGVDTNWLNTSIDSAKAAGLWVIVGNHLNSISTGQKSNEIGTTLDTLLTKKVDLILQGHDHNYQRSKQLTCAPRSTVQTSCIVNNGPNYTKGVGSVLLIDGTGGNGFYGVSASDSEAGYFAAINSNTYGYTKFTVTQTQLSAQFIRAAGGTFSDSFTISSGGGPNPTPVVTPTPTPNPTGTPRPGSTPTPTPIKTATPAPTRTPTPTPAPTNCVAVSNSLGVATFTATAATTGSYRVWSRIMASSNSSNSYYIQVDNGCPTLVGGAVIPLNTWTWVNYQNGSTSQTISFNLAAGAHTVKLIGKSANTKIDRLIITNNTSCIPTGTGDNCATAGTANPAADVNSDGRVNIVDIGIIIDNYGKSPPPNLRADVNGDGTVNIVDIGIVIDNYGL